MYLTDKKYFRRCVWRSVELTTSLRIHSYRKLKTERELKIGKGNRGLARASDPDPRQKKVPKRDQPTAATVQVFGWLVGKEKNMQNKQNKTKTQPEDILPSQETSGRAVGKKRQHGSCNPLLFLGMGSPRVTTFAGSTSFKPNQICISQNTLLFGERCPRLLPYVQYNGIELDRHC